MKISLLVFLIIFLSIVGGANAATSTKTVEYWIISNDTITTIANAKASNNFTVTIPENGVKVRNAYFEINTFKGDAGAAGNIVWTVSLNGSTAASLTAQNDRENMWHRYFVNASSSAASLYDITGPGAYRYFISISSDKVQDRMRSAKLVLTYDYDSASEVQQKTVKFFINNTAAAIAAGATLTNLFNITLPEAQPNIKSAWFEVTGFTDSSGAGTHNVQLNGTAIPQGSPTYAALAEGTGWIYYVNANTTVSSKSLYLMNESGKTYLWSLGANPVTNEWTAFSAIAAVTYTYNSSTTENELRTVDYYIFSDANNSAAATTSTNSEGNVTIQLPENIERVHSSWIYGGGTTDGDGVINLDVLINGTLTRTGNDIKMTGATATAEAAGIIIFTDATPSTGAISPITITDSLERKYQVKFACTTDGCWNTWASMFVTYEFNRTGTTAYLETLKTFLNGSNGKLVAGSLIEANFETQLNGENHTIKNAYFNTITQSEGDPTTPTQQYCHKLNNSAVSVECDKVPGEGFTYSLNFLKNASSSTASLYDITSNNTYKWKYDFKVIGEDTYTSQVVLSVTYKYQTPSEEAALDVSFVLFIPATNITFFNSTANPITNFLLFNSTDINGKKINATAVSGIAQNSTLSIFRYKNTGNTGINITLNFSTSLPSGVTVKAGWNDASYKLSCSLVSLNGTANSDCVNITSIAIILANLSATDAQRDIWLWADYNNYAAGSDNDRNLTHTSQQS